MSSDGRPAPDRPAERRTGRWNALTLRLFGPPHVGHYEGAYPAPDPDPVCPFCNQVESAHERQRKADGKSLRRCPTP